MPHSRPKVSDFYSLFQTKLPENHWYLSQLHIPIYILIIIMEYPPPPPPDIDSSILITFFYQVLGLWKICIFRSWFSCYKFMYFVYKLLFCNIFGRHRILGYKQSDCDISLALPYSDKYMWHNNY